MTTEHKDNSVAEMLRKFLERNRHKTVFLEHEVKGLLRELGISTPKGMFISAAESVPSSHALAYPLVAKVSSSKITSKSEVHGVRTGLKNIDELTIAVRELMHIENAEGALIEEMAPQGVEIVAGGIIDEQFGPVVMFGLGGVFVELFRDISFALAPLKKEDALHLIQQVKGYKILTGYRGRPQTDIDALVKVLVITSEIISTELIREIDLNPVVLYPDSAIALDAKILKGEV